MLTITSLYPIFGYYQGGYTVSLSGTGFQIGVTSLVITLGGVVASGVNVLSDTSLTVVVPELPSPSEYPLVITTNGVNTATVKFYAVGQLTVPSAAYSTNNSSFDPCADYTVFGLWNFAQPPLGIGGGGGFDVNANYTTTGTWNNSGNWDFTGGVNIQSPGSVTTTCGAVAIPGPVPPNSWVVATQGVWGVHSLSGGGVTADAGNLEFVALGGTTSIRGEVDAYITATSGEFRALGQTRAALESDTLSIVDSASKVIIGNTDLINGVTLQLDKTTFKLALNADGGYNITKVPAATPVVGVSTNLPPSGFEILCVDTATGELRRYSPS